MFGAGTETTVHSIRWLLQHLARYQEAQSKVRRELLNVLQEKPPNMDDLAKGGYTEATIAETARIRSIVPLGFPRYARKDFCVDNMKIKKGSLITPLQRVALGDSHGSQSMWKNLKNFVRTDFWTTKGNFADMT